MRKHELDFFNGELQALCAKYKINLLCGFYISQGSDRSGVVDDRAQHGFTSVGERPASADTYNALVPISQKMLQLMDQVKPLFENAHLKWKK